MLSYNFINDTDKLVVTPYDNIIDELRITTPEEYKGMNKEQKDIVLNKMVLLIRNINKYPIYYYNEDGIKKEVEKCIDKNVEIVNNTLPLNLNHGQHLCRQFFPNMMTVKSVGDKRTMWNKFFDDHNLKRAIDFNIKHETFKPYNIYRALLLIGGGACTNFSPMRSKALYEKYCPKDGIIYDYSCGFGGRMLGALSSKNNYTYIGCEPNSETFDNLNKFGNNIEKVTGRNNSYKILKIGSEDFNLKKEVFDFAFSSPPYFNCENYSDEETQCYNKYNDIDVWFDEYVFNTIKNIYDMLKPNCYYAVNIADFNLGGNSSKPIKLVDRWIEISKNIGFEYVETIVMKLNPRRQVKERNGKDKNKEGIFVFKKL